MLERGPAQDAEMMEQIDRDVLRTHPDMHFFSGGDGSAVQHRAVRPCRACRDTQLPAAALAGTAEGALGFSGVEVESAV